MLAEELLCASFPSEGLPQFADVAAAHGVGGIGLDGGKEVEHPPIVSLRLGL